MNIVIILRGVIKAICLTNEKKENEKVGKEKLTL